MLWASETLVKILAHQLANLSCCNSLTDVKIETILTIVTVGLTHNQFHKSIYQLVGW